ncbi:MAG: hypothetical protein JWR07_2597 [Nevskia sp.]|nr:hypothetical protein [Nevskia sp.]
MQWSWAVAEISSGGSSVRAAKDSKSGLPGLVYSAYRQATHIRIGGAGSNCNITFCFFSLGPSAGLHAS